MIGVCPNCGKPFKMEEGKGGEGWTYCAEVCITPAALPTGERLQADQATIKYTDGNMNELSRYGVHKTAWDRSNACMGSSQSLARGTDK